MIEIEINGQTIQANAGDMLIAVTDGQNIAVPRFCYHKKLSVAANCRMCLVDVEGVPKAQPACSTPVAAGMKVWTNNEKAKKSQQAVMEFLLINHPLDCPICDQGGECELQDVAVSYGQDFSAFTEGKRVMPDKDLGPLIQTDMTRCIHCTRCVRFGTEVAGLTEMGGTGRGENLTIEPFLKQGIASELSGNMIDVCPVGALTSKPFRYALRSWELQANPSIARHDNIGSHLWAQSNKNQIKRIVAKDNQAINETWISDRDRFSYEGLTHDNRLLKPKIKVENQWQEVSWEVALDFVVKGINHILNTYQSQAFGALTACSSTLEEYYLLGKLLKALEINHLDYRTHQQHFSKQSYCPSTTTLEQLEQSDYILVIAGQTRLEQPMLNHRLHKANIAGANIAIINAVVFDFNFTVGQTLLTPISQTAYQLAGILKAILQTNQQAIPDNLLDLAPSEQQHQVAKQLLNSANSALVLGEHLSGMADYDHCVMLSQAIAEVSGSGLLNASMKANSASAHLAGLLPGKKGYHAQKMLDKSLKGYLLFDVYPQYDCYDVNQAINAFKSADFVLSFNSFHSKVIDECADVVLPIACFFETAGTHINCQNDQQFCPETACLPSEVKPAWKIIKVIADKLALEGFDYHHIAQIKTQAQALTLPKATSPDISLLGINSNLTIEEIWQNNPYCSDALLRHATSLQQTPIASKHQAMMTQDTAVALGIATDDTYKGVPVVISDLVASHSVFVCSNQAKYQPSSSQQESL